MDPHERLRHPSQEPLPPREAGEIARAVSQIREGRREIVLRLVVDVANADEAFWTKVRKAQVEALLDLAEERGVLLNEIAAVMGVSTSLMTKVKARHEEHPGEPPQPGAEEFRESSFPRIQLSAIYFYCKFKVISVLLLCNSFPSIPHPTFLFVYSCIFSAFSLTSI